MTADLPELVLELDGRTLRLPGDVDGHVLGRGHDADVELTGSWVSREHLLVRTDDAGRWVVVDLGTAHGTWLDGALVEAPTPLRDGATITLPERGGDGRITVRVVATGEPRRPVEAPATAEAPATGEAPATVTVDDAASVPDAGGAGATGAGGRRVPRWAVAAAVLTVLAAATGMQLVGGDPTPTLTVVLGQERVGEQLSSVTVAGALVDRERGLVVAPALSGDAVTSARVFVPSPTATWDVVAVPVARGPALVVLQLIGVGANEDLTAALAAQPVLRLEADAAARADTAVSSTAGDAVLVDASGAAELVLAASDLRATLLLDGDRVVGTTGPSCVGADGLRHEVRVVDAATAALDRLVVDNTVVGPAPLALDATTPPPPSAHPPCDQSEPT